MLKKFIMGSFLLTLLGGLFIEGAMVVASTPIMIWIVVPVSLIVAFTIFWMIADMIGSEL